MKLFIASIIVGLAAFCDALNPFKRGNLRLANVYDEAVETHDLTVPRTNDVAITARHLLWAPGATPSTTVQLATAALPAIGTIDNTESSTGITQTVKLLGKGGTKKMVANAAVTPGTHPFVYQAAGGKVAPFGTIVVGIPLSAAAADDDIIEVDDSPAALRASGTAIAATRTILAHEMDGRTFFFGHATEFVMTLPAPFLGARAKFLCTAAPAGASYTIVTASSANIIIGSFASAADAGGSMDSETSGGDTITFVDGQAVAGDWVQLESDGTNWFATGIAADEDALTITTAS